LKFVFIYLLRLQKPFPSFQAFVDGLDLENMRHEQHSHIPYVALLLKTLEAWRDQIGDPNALPKNFKARKEFITLLMSMQKLNEKGIYNEDNFEEAKHQVIRSFAGIEVFYYFQIWQSLFILAQRQCPTAFQRSSFKFHFQQL
jgi:amyloid beta precursor protein binding protein 1